MNQTINGRNRGAKVTECQKKLMVEFLKNNSEMITGKFSSNFTMKDGEKLWIDLTTILNSVGGGANKDWRSWRKCWHDMRSKTKQKAAEVLKYRRGTGGGPAIPDPLNDTENEIVEIIKNVSVEGHAVIEPTLVFRDADVCFAGNSSTSEDTICNDPDEIIDSQPSCSFWSPEPENNLVQSTPIKKGKKKFPKKLDALIHSSEASKAYVEGMKRKMDMKEKYYARKLELLEEKNAIKKEDMEVKKKAVDILRQIVNVLEELV